MGNNLMISPGAKMDDGWFDVVIYDGMGDAALVQHFVGSSGATPEKLKSYRARHVRITSELKVMANSDKDLTGEQHVIEIKLIPRGLSVIAGNGIGLTLPVEAAPRVSARAVDAPHTNGATEAAIAGPEHAER
jgi:diacylglycerol kinase family enzyme